jgi:hypothetical protein
MARIPAHEMLAKSADFGEVAQKLLPWIAVLLAVLVVLVAGLRYYRRCLDQPAQDSSSGWTLDKIRQLRDAGVIDDAEFSRLRAGLLAEMGVKVGSGSGGANAPETVENEEDEAEHQGKPEAPG